MHETQPQGGSWHEVRVHIDQEVHMSPHRTTGIALYALGRVAEGLELFKEVGGNREDTAVPKDTTELHLKEDEHFHSGKARELRFSIIVNGKEKHWTKERIDYDELVKLSGEPLPPGPDPGFTITYFDGPHDKPEGSVTLGHSVKVKEGMVFNVTPTNRS